jgi:hypothetical protein
MKRILFLLLIALTATAVRAQMSNLIFFTEQGERFFLVVNGIQQNEEATTNVMVTDLPAPSYKIKILFEDPALGEIDKNLVFGQGNETTFAIRRNNKNEWVVRFVSEVPLAQAPPPSPERYVMVYSTAPPASRVTVSQSTMTTTTTTSAAPAGAGIGITVTDPEAGVNINMNVGAFGTTATSTTTSTTMSTTTTVMETPVIAQEPPVYYVPGYSGPVGCPRPMTPAEFSNVKNSIASKSFEDSKLTVARQVIGANCLTCNQVKEIMLLFSFEDTRLELAKYAYGYTYDIRNYYLLNDAFTFESSIEELDEYINGYAR